MGFFHFKSKEEKAMDVIISRIEMNMSNNYKDAAQLNLSELEEMLTGFVSEGKLKDEAKEKYESIVHSYRLRLKGYTHKDQKPYWT